MLPLYEEHVRMLNDAVTALLAAPGDFTVEGEEGYPGRMVLTTDGGTRAVVDLRSVVWGTDGPAACR